MKNPYRIGARTFLRPVERDDAPLLQGWINDPEVTRFLSRYLPVSFEGELAWLDSIVRNPNDLVLGIGLIEDDRLIGVTGIHGIDPKDRRAVFGISIGDKSSWDKGYGSEATEMMTRIGFDTLNLNRLELQVYEYNDRAIRVYEKIGWVREGVSRQRHYHAGRYWDVLNMAILREEWSARQPG